MQGKGTGILRATLFILASTCAWYLGYLLAEVIPDEPLATAAYHIRSIGERPILRAPAPKRHKYDHCAPDTYAYWFFSGGSRDKYAKIYFENDLIIGETTENVGKGINVALVNYTTGKVIATRYFDMFLDDNSVPMTEFLQGAPAKSLLLMMTHDDGSSRLKEDAKKAIEALGSKEIRNIRFRSSWVFLTAKGFELPAGIEREEISHSSIAKNRYSGWPEEIQIKGCIPKEPS